VSTWKRVLTPVLVTLVVAASGFALGWLWNALSPRVALFKVEGGFVYAEAEPEQALAADGWFLILGAAAGVLFAALAWTLRVHRGPVMLLALTVGSLGAAWIAWWFGIHIGLAELNAARDAAPIGARVQAPIGLRITDLDRHSAWQPLLTGVVAVQALAAAFCYTAFAGFSRYPSLRGHDPTPEWPVYPWGQTEGDHTGSRGQTEAADQTPTPGWHDDGSRPFGQLGPGRTGSSETATGTARM